MCCTAITSDHHTHSAQLYHGKGSCATCVVLNIYILSHYGSGAWEFLEKAIQQVPKEEEVLKKTDGKTDDKTSPDYHKGYRSYVPCEMMMISRMLHMGWCEDPI